MNNHPPTDLLRVQTIPTFPLSSPIKEEVSSPFNSSGSDLVDQQQGNPFASPEDDHAQGAPVEKDDDIHFHIQNVDSQEPSEEATNSNRPSRWDSLKRPGRTIMKRNGKATVTKKSRPGLNLVTNFSNDTAKHRRDAVYKRRQSITRNFIDLNDLKSLSKAKDTTEPTQDNEIGHPWKTLRTRGYQEVKDDENENPRLPHAVNRVMRKKKSPLDALRASPSKTQDLSPSDRPIMIGLSVPYNARIPRNASKNEDGTTPTKNTASPHSQRSANTTPATPTIIITPARDDNPWDSFDKSPEQPGLRPASSIYSQPTPRVGDPRPDSVIPPVPAIPYAHRSTKTVDDSGVFDEQIITSTRKHRAFSTGTVFEEDSPISRRVSRSRSFSDENKRGVSNRYSVDTLATRRRSQGWWNYLLSPLISRSNTIASKMSFMTPQDEHPPALPAFPPSHSLQTNDKYLEKNEEVSFFSPDTPYSGEEKQMGDKWGGLPGMRSEPKCESEESDSEFGDDCSQATSRQGRNKTTHSSPVSAQSIPFMMSSPSSAGYAQEYFQQNMYNRLPTGQSPERTNNPFTHNTGAAMSPSDFSQGAGEGTRVHHENSNNPFFQHFVARINTENEPRARSNSDSTIIEDEPDVSPNIRQATATPLLRAAPVGPIINVSTPSSRSFTDQSEAIIPPVPAARPFLHKPSNPSPIPSMGTSSSQPPPYSPPKKVSTFPRYRAILPSDLQPQPHSPGPISPGVQTTMTSRGGIPLSNMDQLQQPLATYNITNNFAERNTLPPRLPNDPVSLSDVERDPDLRTRNEARRQRLEREDQIGRKVGGLWRGRGCFSKNGCFGRLGREGRNRRRWCIVIAILLIMMVLLSVVLAVILTRRKNDDAPVQSRWLNLTGYPPMPTGVSTIAGPNPVEANTACIHPKTMWSCALPKENQEANSPFDADQPNFRIQINFQNGTFLHSTVPINMTTRRRSVSNFPGHQGIQALQTRDKGFTPIPAPPDMNEQMFLGNTTDKNTAPFSGEETPFFATFISPEPITISTRQKRAEDPPSEFPDLSEVIPKPSTNPDGTAAPANLYPLPISQPIRLYDRGLPTEHYGFYTYYDRSIFLKSDDPIVSSEADEVPDDANGGCTRSAARVRCTWTQTRFLVRIWTQPEKAGKGLIPHATPTTTTAAPTSTSSAGVFPPEATDFARPGSFPYPVTIVLDRHGGDPSAKMIYCYGLDTRQKFIMDEKKLQVEFREAGGKLVNPAGLFDLPGDDDSLSSREVKSPGFDGGTGGCRCEWRNWLETR
ncbi:hypothetical protein FQN55_005405 [Onygenales sp. PD_40]|nr:hypothetical protein FQN55_005405 [Onygenales sp. PD_40]KAK2788999.1 hypothetical protein FQN53_002815 [Emmonsiellopsis sp. PD_33]KAK2796180.1 hypothetical protein FQN52_000158 [Onygenales sp. PD_12]